MVNFKEIYHFSRFQRGSKIFQGGSNFFQVGSICLFPIETHITCDFPGGSGPPAPPLWIRTCLYIWVKLYLPIKYQYKLRNVVLVSPGFYFVSSKKHDCRFKYSDVYFLPRKPANGCQWENPLCTSFAKILVILSCYRWRYFDCTISIKIFFLSSLKG